MTEEQEKEINNPVLSAAHNQWHELYPAELGLAAECKGECPYWTIDLTSL